MDEVTLTADRIISTNVEGFRADVYDDATGKALVLASGGNPTVGYGCLVRGWSQSFARGVLMLQLGEFNQPLLQFAWYTACDAYRRSAILEIAYNQGDSGLLLHYPHLIAAVARQDWATAQTECNVSDPRLKARYARIGQILLTGSFT